MASIFHESDERPEVIAVSTKAPALLSNLSALISAAIVARWPSSDMIHVRWALY